MAKEAPPPAAPAEAQPNKGKKLVITALIILILLVVLGIVGAVFLLTRSNSAEEGEEEDVVTEVKPHKKKARAHDLPPVFVKLDKFTINLKPGEHGGEGYAQADITLQVDDIAADLHIKNHLPRIKNDIMMLVSDKTADELNSKDGKLGLSTEIRDAINAVIGVPSRDKTRPPEGPVEDVLFESFIIQ